MTKLAKYLSCCIISLCCLCSQSFGQLLWQSSDLVNSAAQVWPLNHRLTVSQKKDSLIVELIVRANMQGGHLAYATLWLAQPRQQIYDFMQHPALPEMLIRHNENGHEAASALALATQSDFNRLAEVSAKGLKPLPKAEEWNSVCMPVGAQAYSFQLSHGSHTIEMLDTHFDWVKKFTGIETVNTEKKLKCTFSETIDKTHLRISIPSDALIFAQFPIMQQLHFAFDVKLKYDEGYRLYGTDAKTEDRIAHCPWPQSWQLLKLSEPFTFDLPGIKAEQIIPFQSQYNIYQSKQGWQLFSLLSHALVVNDTVASESDLIRWHYFPEKLQFRTETLGKHVLKRLEIVSSDAVPWPDHTVTYLLPNGQLLGGKVINRLQNHQKAMVNSAFALTDMHVGIVSLDFEPDDPSDADPTCRHCLNVGVFMYVVDITKPHNFKEVFSLAMALERYRRIKMNHAESEQLIEGVDEVSLEWLSVGKKFRINTIDRQSGKRQKFDYKISKDLTVRPAK